MIYKGQIELLIADIVDVLCCSLLVIEYFLIATYFCAFWDLERPEIPVVYA